MLLLVFHCGSKRYGLDAARIIEVTPWAALQQLTPAPPALCGLLNYRGAQVPVVDLCSILGGAAARPWMSTRIVLLEVGAPAVAPRLVGFLVERATETIHADQLPAAIAGAEGLQRIDPWALLPEALRKALWDLPKAAGSL